MQLGFSVRYESGKNVFDGLDHYYGAQSLLGISQALLIALHAFFNREVITQAPSAKGFRLLLGPARKGSWEQLLSLVITNPDVLQVANDLGKNALYDLLKWALLSGVGVPFVLGYRKARKVVRELEQDNDDLQEKLDHAILKAHQPVKHQGLSVHVMCGRTNLATFDDHTLRYIETEIKHEATERIRRAVSRFNARTGTGRFIRDLNAVSVPFQPEDKLSDKVRRALADNLGLVARDEFVPLTAVVSKVTSKDGRLKYYNLHSLVL